MSSDPEITESEEGGRYEADYLMDIHRGIVNDDSSILLHALESGVNVNEKFTRDISPDHVGMTPLALASALNKLDAVKLLLSHKADVGITYAALNTTVLMTSSYHGHTKVVQLLLKNGADVNTVDLQGSSALGYALGGMQGSRNIDVINQLLKAGINVNHRNMLGMNAILLVAGHGDGKMVKLILEAGADPNVMNDFGHSALHLAVAGKRAQLKKLTSGNTGQFGLNRQNIDLALKEWTRLNLELIQSDNKEAELEKVGKFMMNIGYKLGDPDTTLDDDQEAMSRRVEAVYRCRQDKVEEMRSRKKSDSILNSFLSCGGGKKSKKSKRMKLHDSPPPPGAGPTKPAVPLTADVEREVIEATERYCRVLQLLIDAGCNVDTTERTFGLTALDMAILLGDVESTAVLMASGGNPSHLMEMFTMSDLHEAIVLNDKKRVKELLMYDDDVSVNECFTQFNASRHRVNGLKENIKASGMTPLTVAAQIPDLEILKIMKLLIKKGADVNKHGPGGSSPLAEAARTGNLKMVQFLLQNGADIELTNPEYKNATAVVLAVMNRHMPVVNFLIQKGAKVDKQLSDNSSSVIKASENIDQPMIEKLLGASLIENYSNKESFMYKMAEKFQKDKDMKSILGLISEESKKLILANKPQDPPQTTVDVNLEPIPPTTSTAVVSAQATSKQPAQTPEDLDKPIPPPGEKQANIRPSLKEKLTDVTSSQGEMQENVKSDNSESLDQKIPEQGFQTSPGSSTVVGKSTDNDGTDETDDDEDTEEGVEEEQETEEEQEETEEETEEEEEVEEEYYAETNDGDGDDEGEEQSEESEDKIIKIINRERMQSSRKRQYARKRSNTETSEDDETDRVEEETEEIVSTDEDNDSEEDDDSYSEEESERSNLSEKQNSSGLKSGTQSHSEEQQTCATKSKSVQKSVAFAPVQEEDEGVIFIDDDFEAKNGKVIQKHELQRPTLESGNTQDLESSIHPPQISVKSILTNAKPEKHLQSNIKNSDENLKTPLIESPLNGKSVIEDNKSGHQVNQPSSSMTHTDGLKLNPTAASVTNPNNSSTHSVQPYAGPPNSSSDVPDHGDSKAKPISLSNKNLQVPASLYLYSKPTKPSLQVERNSENPFRPGSPPPSPTNGPPVLINEEDEAITEGESFEEESFEEKYQTVSQALNIDTQRPEVSPVPIIVTDIVSKVPMSSLNHVQYAAIALAEDDDDDDDTLGDDDTLDVDSASETDINEEYNIPRSLVNHQQQRYSHFSIETEI